METFEQASHLKLRFVTTKGELSTEDLWELSLSTLDTIAKNVHRMLLSEQEESFIPGTVQRKSTHNELRLTIIKQVIAWRVAKEQKGKIAAEIHARVARLKDLALQKHDEALAAQGVEEIDRQIAALEAALLE